MFSLPQLLSGQFVFLSQILTVIFDHLPMLFFHELLSFFCMILPDDAKNSVRIFRCDRRSYFFSFKGDLDKLLFAVPVAIIREPVVEMFTT